MHKICLCPKSIAWILRNLKKSSKTKFKQMIAFGDIMRAGKKRGAKRRKSKKHRSPAQRRAIKKLIAFNKRRRR